MKVNANIIKKENALAVLEIAVDKEAISEEFHNVLRNYQKSAVLPGFRKGKAPVEMIKNKFKDKIYEDVLSNLIPHAYKEAVDITKISPYTMPEIKIENFDENSLKFKADVPLQPEIVIGHYKNVSFKKDEFNISQADINNELKKMQERFADFTLKEGKIIEDTDIVLLKVEAFDSDGNILKELCNENQRIEVVKGNLYDEFYNNLLGAKTDEEKEFIKEYPDNFNNQLLAAKKVNFKVKIKEIRVKKLPVLDDEFAKDVGDYKSIDELRKAIENQLKELIEKHLDRQLQKQINGSIIEHSKFEIPAKLIKERTDSLLNEFKQNLARQGHDFKMMIDKKIISLQKIQEEVQEQAVRDLKEYLIMIKIAELEKIEVNDLEIDELIKKEAQDRQQDLEEYKKKFTENTRFYIKQTILFKKVEDFLKTNNKIKKGKTVKVEDIIKEMERRV